MDKKIKTPKSDKMDDNELKFAMNVLRDLIKDSAFSKQRKIFEDIQKAIEKASEKERRTNARCLKLQSEIEANTSKIKAAIQLSDEDKNTIDTLKEELEKAWNISEKLKIERCNYPEADGFLESEKCSHRNSSYSSIHSFQRKCQDFDEAEKTWTSEKKSLQIEVESLRKSAGNYKTEIKQLQQQIKNMNSILSKKNEEIKRMETNLKVAEEIKVDRELERGDKAAILDEIEKNRLQIFELEEELTNKEKVIEELTKENELKSEKIEHLEKEFLTTKNNSFISEKVEEEKISSEVKQNKKVENVCESKKHKNLEKQINELLTKENEMVLKLEILEFSLSEKINLLSKIQNDNYVLKVALHKEKELYNGFPEKYNTLKIESNKSIKALKELENLRNRYVSVIGKLETKNSELKRELATLEHFKYPEKVEILENNLLKIRKELEEKEKHLKETNEEISRIRRETEAFSKHLKDSLKIIEPIHASDIFTEAKQNLFVGKLHLHEENINLSFLNFKSKIKDIVERYKEITKEKYKLYDEIELLKNQRYSVKEKESKGSETEAIYFEEQNSKDGAEIFSDDHMFSLNIPVLEKNLHFKESDKVEKVNEEARFQELDTYLSFLKPKMVASDVEISTLNSELEHKSSKVDLNNSYVTQDEERKSSFETILLDRPTEEILNKSLGIQEDGDTHFLQKTIKKGTSTPDIVASQDLVKYRRQLRTHQKKLDTMKRELESSSSSFSTSNAIYQKDSWKRTMNSTSKKKLSVGKNERK